MTEPKDGDVARDWVVSPVAVPVTAGYLPASVFEFCYTRTSAMWLGGWNLELPKKPGDWALLATHFHGARDETMDAVIIAVWARRKDSP